jgi:predicted membrane protein
MSMHRRLTTKDVALASTFTALYVVFGFLKISPIIGLPGQAITAAAIMAPLIGIILGPYVGTLSAFLGGVIGFFFGSFSQLSLASGVVAALCSGMVHRGRRVFTVLVYLSLFLLLAFYPSVGPIWLFPIYVWFQVIGFIILVSPLQTIATKYLNPDNSSRLLFAFFVTSLVSTLAGQIAGTLTLEIIHLSNVDYLATWIGTTLLYPVERTIIALGAALVGVSLYKILKSTNFTFVPDHADH